jgi:hypothetical protein
MGVIQKIMKAGALPPEWREHFPDPEKDVRVEIREIDNELGATKTLEEVMDLISRRAEKRGLTPELLEEIINEET